MRRRMTWIVCGLLLAAGVFTVWKFTARSAYESAAYTVVVKDGDFEVREYPDLVLATTPMRSTSQGGDGSFMRLFGYISGKNSEDRKLAMTVPVFMETDDQESTVMGFVVPKQVVDRGVPSPSGTNVEIKTRTHGRFATIRFSGQITSELTTANQSKLRSWMLDKGLEGEIGSEVAGYDPPWLPGPLRRNEILIRITE